jgi:hypothetical protein
MRHIPFLFSLLVSSWCFSAENNMAVVTSAEDWYITQKPDYRLTVCQQVVSGKPEDAKYFNGVGPASIISVQIGNKTGRHLFGDDAILASIKAALLEPTKHGKLNRQPSSRPVYLYYMYESDINYNGKDKAVFMTEFENIRYELVINFIVEINVDENSDQGPCPQSQLIKLKQ